MDAHGRTATRRQFVALAATAAAGGGCLQARSEQPAAAVESTATPPRNHQTRRDVVRCYAEALDRLSTGRSELFDGHRTFQDGRYHAAIDAFDRSIGTLDRAREEIRRAYDLLSWLDLGSESDGAMALRIVEDTGNRVFAHLDAAREFRRAAASRAGDDSDAGEPLARARRHLEAAEDYPAREPSVLASALSIDEW